MKQIRDKKTQESWKDELKNDCKQKVNRWSKNGLTTGKKSLDGEMIIEIDLDDDESNYIKLWESLYLFTRVRVDRIVASQRTQLLEEIIAMVEGLKKESWQNKIDDRDLQNQKIGYNQALDDLLSELSKLEEGDV